MQENDYRLGGEQSGHIILKKYATTGDGILTAIMITEEVCSKKTSLSKLVEPLKLYPQFTKNIRVKSKDGVFADKEVLSAVEKVNELIAGKGRALLRKSGTEPVVRIMIEAETKELCEKYTEMISVPIINGRHSSE